MIRPKKEKTSFKFNTEKSIKKLANNFEAIVAKDIDGILSPNSGATDFMKADIHKGGKVIDVKTAIINKQIVIKESMLIKIENDAVKHRKDPVLILYFPNSTTLRNKKWIVKPIE